jgi:hypothetical protein
MTLQQFKALSQDRQYRNLLLNGVCITSRDTEDNCILLFQLNGFYVEIYFDKNCDEIIDSRSFKETDELYPYLKNIDISEIM